MAILWMAITPVSMAASGASRVRNPEPAQGTSEEISGFLMAARQGNAFAQETLAARYYFGEGVQRDRAEALRWIQSAIQRGGALAKAYFPDARVDSSPLVALRWLRLGAELGIGRAQECLGVKLYLGDEVPRNPDEAEKYLEPAAQKGLARAQYYLSQLYRSGEGAPADWRRAIELLRKAADQNYADAQLEMGVLLVEGKEVPPDDAEAVARLRKAAAAGLEQARAELWELREQKRAAPVTAAEGREWLRAAAQSDGPAAQRAYGDVWLRREVSPDHVNEYASERMAAYWYQKAARRGDAEAELALARMSLAGRGQPRSPGEALYWATLAQNGGLAAAGEVVAESSRQLDPTEISEVRKRVAAARSKP